MYELLLGKNVHWQNREAWVYSHDVHTRYPFQGALHGLPPDVIRECIVGAIEARYGTIDGKTEVSPTSKESKVDGATKPNGTQSMGNDRLFGDVKDCCADGILESTAPHTRVNGNGRANADEPASAKKGNSSDLSNLVKALSRANGNGNGHSNGGSKCQGNGLEALGVEQAEPKFANFEEFIYGVWGRGIAKHFAIPYNRKLWAVPLSEMETSWLGGRVPQPNLEEMIDGALQSVAKPQGPNARFGYPLHGGFQALMDGFLPHVSDQLQLNTSVSRVSVREKTVTTGDGRQIPFKVLVSTMPLPLLIRAMGDEAPVSIQEAARKLRYVSVRCVNLGVGRPNLTEKHWIYYPGPTVFHRIFVQGNASPQIAGTRRKFTSHDGLESVRKL